MKSEVFRFSWAKRPTAQVSVSLRSVKESPLRLGFLLRCPHTFGHVVYIVFRVCTTHDKLTLIIRYVKADISAFLCSGAETGWTDLTALAVVSIQLFDKDGSAIQVSDPIHVSVPLPSDTRNRMATSVPAWLYQPKTGKKNVTLYNNQIP